MKHVCCGCPQCEERRPPSQRPCCKKDTSQCVLLQKIMGQECRDFPSLCVTLKAQGIPCRAKPPYQLQCVQQSGASPWWTPLESSGPCRRLCMRVFVPVCMQFTDACGEWFCAESVIELDMSVMPGCIPSESWRHQAVIVACVRLRQPAACSQDGCFEADVEARVEVYFVRLEPCAMRRPSPACPELPLYPPPCAPIPPRWPQCPAAPHPCG